jgi:hypothetical protein
MTYKKTIVCLANSRKPPSGRCVAGREFVDNAFGPWLRPVSARSTEEISEEERRYETGQDPRVLDIISITLSGPKPHRHQTENHVIDADYHWQLKGTVTWEQLQQAVEVIDAPLWRNGYSTYYGLNDRVPESEVAGLVRSLYLIRPNDLGIAVVKEGAEFGNPRRRVRALFKSHRASYSIIVTDPVVERQYLGQADGTYHLNDAVLCMSLSGMHDDGFAYKLAAAVITPQSARS